MKSLKTKIYIALISLSVLILSLGLFGSSFISRLAEDSRSIIQDNYNSIEYVENMSVAVDRIYELYIDHFYSGGPGRTAFPAEKYKKAVAQFTEGLKNEANNITESGEYELSEQLTTEFQEFVTLTSGITANKPTAASINELDHKRSELHRLLSDIQQINMYAIKHKSQRADDTAGRVSVYMMLTGTLAVLFSLLLLYYFPGYLLRPLYELTSKIKEVAKGRYNQKLNISSKDEIGELAVEFNTMALKLNEYEQNNIHKLLVEKKRLQAIVQGLNDAVLILDEKKQIIFANRFLLELTGLGSEDLLGRYAPDIATRNDLIRYMIQDIEANTDDPKSSHTASAGLGAAFRSGDEYFSKEVIEIKLDENALAADNFAGHICVLKNITEYQERDTAKTNLIATVSHELKTPLSSINISLKLLENTRLGEINEAQRKIVSSIRQQTHRLSKMVNELLDFSQAESGNIRLRMSDAQPADIIDYAATAVMVPLAEKNIQLETRIPDGLPPVHADLEKTVWVLTNLITNAERYTPENGTIILAISDEEKEVVFSVKDCGPGIPEEEHANIFNKFVQVGESDSKGRGLGLAISREFVRAQGGNIWLDSRPGEGSTFYFSIPCSGKP